MSLLDKKAQFNTSGTNVRWVPIEQVVPAVNPEEKYALGAGDLAKKIQTSNFFEAIEVLQHPGDDNLYIEDGNTRYAAAMLMGMKEVPVGDIQTGAEKRADFDYDTVSDHFEGLGYTAIDVLSEWKANLKNPNYRQRWEVIPAPRLKKIWQDYMKTGFVRDEKGIGGIASIIIENIHKMEINNILTGHTPDSPEEWAADQLGEKIPEGYFDVDNAFFDDGAGQARISDYAADKLSSAAMRLAQAKTAEQKLQIIDHILNIVHQRSDIAAWFVQGGTATLNDIAGKTKSKKKGSFALDAKMHHAASTQIDVPGGVAAQIITIGNKFIPEEALQGEGRVETSHVTVKYGVEENEEKLRAVVAGYAPFTCTLGKTKIFTASENNAGGTPVVVEVTGSQLAPLHKSVMDAMGTEKDVWPYAPHLTIAYVKPEMAKQYEGSDVFVGITFQATSVVLSKHNDDDQVKVPLGKTAAKVPASNYLIWVARGNKIWIEDQEVAWSHDSWTQELGIPNDVYLKRGYVVIHDDDLDQAPYVEIQSYSDFAPNAVVQAIKAKYPALKKLKWQDKVFHPEKNAAAPAVAPEIAPIKPMVPEPEDQEEDDEVQRDQPAVEEPEYAEDDARDWSELNDEEQPEPQAPPKELPQSPKGWRAPKKPVTQTTNFKKWFGKSKIVDDDGQPLKVYHGTTHDIEEFDINETNVENFYGAGFYFSSSALDVSSNYATPTGGDITSRINRLAEQLEQQILDEGGISEEEDVATIAMEQAMEKLLGPNQGVTMPVYLSITNPVIVQKNSGTYFEMNFDEDTEEESGTGVDLYHALMNVSGEWGVDGQKIWTDVFETTGGSEFTAYEFEQAVRGLDYIEDAEGNMNSGGYISDIYQRLGYDGVIMDAWQEFGGGSKYNKMQMDDDTKHYIVWDASKIKSAMGNRGKFDKTQQNITAGTGDLSLINSIVSEMMGLLAPGLPKPEIKVVNSPRAGWLGQDVFRLSTNSVTRVTTFPETTIVQIQKSIVGDENTLRRIIAHELCHHEDQLVNNKPEIERMGLATYNMLSRGMGHGPKWRAIAARFNAKYGANFVTEKSDESYAVEKLDLRPYFILLKKDDNQIYYSVASRLGSSAKKFVSWHTGDEKYRITKTTDHDFINGANIGTGWSYSKPTDTQRKEKLEKLWNEAPVSKWPQDLPGMPKVVTEQTAAVTEDAHDRLGDLGQKVVEEVTIGDYDFFITYDKNFGMYQVGMQRVGMDASDLDQQMEEQKQDRGAGSRQILRQTIQTWLNKYHLLVIGSMNPAKTTKYTRLLTALGFKPQEREIMGVPFVYLTDGTMKLGTFRKDARPRKEDTTSLTFTSGEKSFPPVVLVRWEQGMRWREVLKAVKGIAGHLAGKRVPWRKKRSPLEGGYDNHISIWETLWNTYDEQQQGWEEYKHRGNQVMYDVLKNGAFVSVGKPWAITGAVAVGADAQTCPDCGQPMDKHQHLGSHKTPPLSDTRYRDPQSGEETNAYSNIPEFVEGTEAMPALETLVPDAFKTGGQVKKAKRYKLYHGTNAFHFDPSPESINTEMTAWKNLVASDEHEIELIPGTEVPITGWKYKGETAWQKPPKKLRQVMATHAAPGQYIYHVTYIKNLDSIASNGLSPNAESGIGGPALQGHKAGKVFLTDSGGVNFWLNRAETFAYHNSDNPGEDGLVPVVLRMREQADWKLKLDDIGSDDSGHEAFYYPGVLSADDIEVWDGKSWGSIYSTNLNAMDYVDEEGYLQDTVGQLPKFGAGGDEYDMVPQHGMKGVGVHGSTKWGAIWFTSSTENAEEYADPKTEGNPEAGTDVNALETLAPQLFDKNSAYQKAAAYAEAQNQTQHTNHQTYGMSKVLKSDPFAEETAMLKAQDIITQKQPKEAAAPAPARVDVQNTPEFKGWFGNSKVVDESGAPAMVFHATMEDFTEFKTNPRKEILYTHSAMDTIGAWFAQDKKLLAEAHRHFQRREGPGPRTIPVYLSIKNPLVVAERLDMDKALDALVEKTDPKKYERWETALHSGRKLPAVTIAKGWRRALEASGYDGIKIENDYHGTAWVALFPNQIKSAIGNSGNFNPDDPNIVASKTAADYPGMFKQALALEPEFTSRVDQEIAWAKKDLKKSDRIVWWLRWYRLALLEVVTARLEQAGDEKDNAEKANQNFRKQQQSQPQNSDTVQRTEPAVEQPQEPAKPSPETTKAQQARQLLQNEEKALSQRTGRDMMGIPHKSLNWFYGQHDSLQHFMSLPVAKIQNTVWDKQTPDALEKEFQGYEREWQEQTKGTLTPNLKPREVGEDETQKLQGDLDALNSSIEELESEGEGVDHQRLIDLKNLRFEVEQKMKAQGNEVDTIFLQFQDGWAWWKLSRAYCSEEARAMGHCGNVVGQDKPDERILSLRKPVKAGGEERWEPHLTFILEPSGLLGEMKGKANTKPTAAYHKYIIPLLQKPAIKGIRGGGYAPEKNFSLADLPKETQDELTAAKPGLLNAQMYLAKYGPTDDLVKRINGSLEWDNTYDEEGQAWVIGSFPTLDDFIQDRGNDTAKWIGSVLKGDEFVDYDSYGDWTDSLTNLDGKGETVLYDYLRTTYPEEIQEWENQNDEEFTDAHYDIKRLIEESDLNDVKDGLNRASETGKRYGAEQEMYKAITYALDNMQDDDNNEMGIGIAYEEHTDPQTGKKSPVWDSEVREMLPIAAAAKLADSGSTWQDFGENQVYGYDSSNVPLNVSEPNYGWDGWDKQAFMDEFMETFGSPESPEQQATKQKSLEEMAKNNPDVIPVRDKDGKITGWNSNKKKEPANA